MGYLVWLPRGDSRQLEGKVSGFCFPKERLLRRPFIVTEDENQEFLVWAPSKLLEARRSLEVVAVVIFVMSASDQSAEEDKDKH